jgi:hypothetical protein
MVAFVACEYTHTQLMKKKKQKQTKKLPWP